MLPTPLQGLSCKLLFAASCAALALLTGGCSQMQTQCATSTINEGVPYYLPKKLARVTVLKTESGSYDAKLVETAPVADPKHFYVAKPKHNIFRSDMIDLRTTPEGLMSSAFVTSERRNAMISDNILFNTAFYNKDGLKDQLVRGMREAVEVNYAVEDCEPGCKAFEAVFDPSSCEHVATISGHLKRYNLRLEVAQAQTGPATPGVVDASGVVVRPTVLTPMAVMASDGKVVASLGGMTPDQNPLFNIPTRNGLFSKHTANVEMREGTLTGYYSRKPSEVAGFLQTTAETAEDVARIAGAIIAPIAAAVEVKEPASDNTQTSEKTGATQVAAGGGDGGTNLADIYLTDRVIDTIDEDDLNNDADANNDGECDFPNTAATKRSKLRRALRF